MSQELLVITTGPDMEIGARMLRSAAIHGLDVLPYAVGPMGSPHGGDIQGQWVVDLLKTCTNEIILAVDMPDVMFMAGAQEIVEKFKSFGTGMVISTESNCVSPVGGVPDFMDKIPGRHKYINIGVWIGYRQTVIDVLQKSMDLYRHKPIDPTFDLDSPAAWLHYGIMQGTMPESKGVDGFTLDRDCVLFQSTNGPSRADMELREDNRVYNIATGTCPVLLHYCGSAGEAPRYASFMEMFDHVYGGGSGVGGVV